MDIKGNYGSSQIQIQVYCLKQMCPKLIPIIASMAQFTKKPNFEVRMYVSAKEKIVTEVFKIT